MAGFKYARNMRMKGVRIQNGDISQSQAAAKVGYTTQYYSRVERGMCDGCVDFWRKFQKAFNLSDSDAWQTMNNQPMTKNNE